MKDLIQINAELRRLRQLIVALQTEVDALLLIDHTHTDALDNVWVGENALDSIVDGFGNVAVGDDTLTDNVSGNFNVAVGWNSLMNTTSNDNTGLGRETLRDDTTGENNTAIGAVALRENISGSGNVGIGNSSLGTLTTGDSNLAMGTNAGTGGDASGCVYLGNETGIGNNTDNLLFIGNNATLPLLAGTMDALAANQVLTVNALAVNLPSIPSTSAAGVWKDGTVLRYGASGDSVTEVAQDAVGTILTDTATIDFTYTDATPTITADVKTDSVTNTLLANMVEATVKGRAVGAGTGDPTDLTAAQLVTIINTADGAGSLLDADFLDGNSSAAFATAVHAHAGEDITSGTVADARIASTITRDSEVFGIVLGADGSGSGLDADLVRGTTPTTFGLSLLDDAAASDGRTTLGLGTIATETETNYVLAAGTRALTGDWDLGEDRSINAERIEARDAEGLRIEDDGGNLAVFVEDGGFVGINGVTNPNNALEVAGSWPGAYGQIVVRAATGEWSGFSFYRDTKYGAYFIFRSDDIVILQNHNDGAFGVTALNPSGGTVAVGALTANARLDVSQTSTTAAIPTLELEQADLSEEFVNFVSTVGTGNPIEAVGAKTLTTTHFIRVAFNGTLRYIPIGTIA